MKKFLTLGVFLAGAAVITALRHVSPLETGLVPLSDAGRTKGPPGATIQVVEYLDYGCAACATGVQTLVQYMDRFPGTMGVTLRYFPLHDDSSAVFAECAARQNKFWEFSEALLSRQAQWKQSPDSDGYLKQVAGMAGLDEELLDVCRQEEGILSLVRESKLQGKASGVKSTPTYFVNGRRLVGIKALRNTLDGILQEKVPVAPLPDSSRL